MLIPGFQENELCVCVIVVYGCQSQEGYLEEGAAPSGTVPGTSDSVRYPDTGIFFLCSRLNWLICL
jgi:hypothetical protein